MEETFATSLGKSVATQATSNLVNLPFNALQCGLGYLFGERAANNADARQRAQWRDMYSIEAQLRQIKKAGLSPSIMYGGTPTQGGATAPQGNGGAYATAQLAHISPMDVAQMQKTDAERRLIEEEIKNKEADTKNKGAQFNNLLVDFENKQIQRRTFAAEADLAECNASLAWDTYQANLENAYAQSKKALADANISELKAELDEATWDAAFQSAYAELDTLLAENALTREEIKLNKAQIKEISYNIWQVHKEQYRKDKQFNQDINNMRNMVKLELMKLNQGAEGISASMSAAKINAVSHIVGSLMNFGGLSLMAMSKGGVNTVIGFK